MNMKKVASVALAAALSASLLAGCGGGEGGSDSVTLKIGDNWGATHPMAAALDTVFKPQIEEQTGGAVKVEVYHDGLLGDEAALWQGVRDGSVDFTVVGTPMNQEFPMMLISDWPFLYRDLDHAKNVWTGEVADEVSAAFNEKFPEVEMLSWGPNSARTFTSNKPLTCVDDFAGQKFRMPNNHIHNGIEEDLGASAQVISLGELFTALETGTVDGQDNGMVTVVAQSFQEVQKYQYETNHIVATLEIIGNKDAMSKLTEEQQQIVRDAAKAIPEEQVMTMRSLCGTKWQNFRHLIWPACLPGILTALRTSLGIALALLFITETFAAFSGLGYFIMNRMEVRNYEEMYAAILTLAAIGIIAYMALDIAERKLCPWKK